MHYSKYGNLKSRHITEEMARGESDKIFRAPLQRMPSMTQLLLDNFEVALKAELALMFSDGDLGQQIWLFQKAQVALKNLDMRGKSFLVYVNRR